MLAVLQRFQLITFQPQPPYLTTSSHLPRRGATAVVGPNSCRELTPVSWLLSSVGQGRRAELVLPAAHDGSSEPASTSLMAINSWLI
jgi:hypothetical protein